MPETPEDISGLLRQAQQSDPVVTEFAWVWLEVFRREALEVVRRQHREGQQAALLGEDLDLIRQRSEERLSRSRERLLGRLQRLMHWAEESGRSAPSAPDDPEPDGETEPPNPS